MKKSSGIVERFHNISSKFEKLNAFEIPILIGKDEFYGLIDEISKEI